jgi:hypothetical protein
VGAETVEDRIHSVNRVVCGREGLFFAAWCADGVEDCEAMSCDAMRDLAVSLNERGHGGKQDISSAKYVMFVIV